MLNFLIFPFYRKAHGEIVLRLPDIMLLDSQYLVTSRVSDGEAVCYHLQVVLDDQPGLGPGAHSDRLLTQQLQSTRGRRTTDLGPGQVFSKTRQISILT